MLNELLRPFSLDGKIALVTGASSGFGRHFATVLAKAGASVVLAARRTELIQGAAGEIELNAFMRMFVRASGSGGDSLA